MQLTNSMLQAAVDKAIEAGLLPKAIRKDSLSAEREIIRLVVQAALEADTQHHPAQAVHKEQDPI